MRLSVFAVSVLINNYGLAKYSGNGPETSTPSNDWDGLVYYNYRYYSQQMGRWLSHDTIGEEGGINLYGFVLNNSISRWDKLGLFGMGFPDLPPGLPETPPGVPVRLEPPPTGTQRCCGNRELQPEQECCDSKKETSFNPQTQCCNKKTGGCFECQQSSN